MAAVVRRLLSQANLLRSEDRRRYRSRRRGAMSRLRPLVCHLKRVAQGSQVAKPRTQEPSEPRTVRHYSITNAVLTWIFTSTGTQSSFVAVKRHWRTAV